MDATTTTHARLYRARCARAVAGGVLIVTAITTIIAAVAVDLGPLVMATGWVVGALALLLGPLWVPLARDPARAAARLAPWSMRLPMIGLALLAPLTLHCIVLLFTGSDMREMSRWIGISAVVVGQAHLTLAWLANRDATLMASAMTSAHPPAGWKPLAWGALWKTTLAASIPSVILLAVPPLLTFITGAAFVPLMYWVALRVTAWERACEEWLILAERTGLTPTVLPAPRLPTLTGTIDGVSAELSGWRLGTGDMMFELEVDLPAADLLHLSITSNPTAPAEIRIGEPVADSVLRISSSGSTDTSALAERIRDPDCYAALMEVVHGRGGCIKSGRIRLTTSATSLAPVWEALPQLIDLARLLRSPSALEDGAPITPPQPVRRASPGG